jgi:hypothetical protein
MLDAPTMPIKRLGLLKLSMRISKIGRQIALERGLIAFDDKERKGSFWIGLGFRFSILSFSGAFVSQQ